MNISVYDIEMILKYIVKKKKEYYDKYGVEAKYVKVPYFFKSYINSKLGEFMTFNNDECTIYGLKICETHSISTFFDMEVF